ncbi:hypothetical protein [Paenibacillus segetis]|uniref:Uncharacterized protein n=1 Tax=Paenibacillus segetis TaxID=1325360 RepID=A0ABQ1Y3C4_9BACL|nr:hypothetical protein [Paenibacillus segetis]GGH11019.1 hypothetical protein GCM10008013_02660 [Paenibacillus segetis]
MRNIAIGIFLVVLLSILVEPLVELAVVFKEKLQVSTALANACRVSNDRSLEYARMTNLSAEIDEDKYREYFETAFADAMNVSHQSTTGNTMTFSSLDGKYNDFIVTLDFTPILNDDDQYVTEVKAKAESKYKFKTKYMKLAEAAYEDVDFQIVSDKEFKMSVKN